MITEKILLFFTLLKWRNSTNGIFQHSITLELNQILKTQLFWNLSKLGQHFLILNYLFFKFKSLLPPIKIFFPFGD